MCNQLCSIGVDYSDIDTPRILPPIPLRNHKYICKENLLQFQLLLKQLRTYRKRQIVPTPPPPNLQTLLIVAVGFNPKSPAP